jgi:23S rRNA pseudouridine1911/1915/1917 synthase
LNGRAVVKGQRVRAGDEVLVPGESLPAPPPPSSYVVRETLDVLVASKPAGLPSVHLRGSVGDSFARWIELAFPECASVGAPGEAGLAHRLDTGTSGLLLVARTPEAYDDLRRQFTARQIEKTYLAVVAGHVTGPMRIDAPLGAPARRSGGARPRDPDSARDGARAALTFVVPIEGAGAATVVRATTRSGARHQVRAHLAAAGFPLLADRDYGGPPSAGLASFLLHAESLRWRVPGSGAAAYDRSEPPGGWTEVLARLRAEPDR